MQKMESQYAKQSETDDSVIELRLGEDCGAVVFTPEGCELLIRNPLTRTSETVPPQVAFAAGIAMRALKDEAWRQDLFKWMDSKIAQNRKEDEATKDIIK